MISRGIEVKTTTVSQPCRKNNSRESLSLSGNGLFLNPTKISLVKPRGIFRILSKIFLKIVGDFWLLTIFAKFSSLDGWQDSEYASGVHFRSVFYEPLEVIIE